MMSAMKPSAKKPSAIPVPKKHRARPAPNFDKLHRKWNDQFETGKACNKKPCTVPQGFLVTPSGTKFNKKKDQEDDIDFERDRLALESILSNRGINKEQLTGRSTIAGPVSARKMRRSKSANSLGKRRILGELLCDPDQKQGRRRSRSAKKAIKLASDSDNEFEKDESALASILNHTGIGHHQGQQGSRATFAGPTNVARQSQYRAPTHDPKSVMDACEAYRNLVLTKLIPHPQSHPTVEHKQDFTDCYINKTPEKRQQEVHPSPFTTERFSVLSQQCSIAQSPFGSTLTAPIRHSIYKNYRLNPLVDSPYTDQQLQKTPKRTPVTSARRVPNSNKTTSKKYLRWADILQNSPEGNPTIRKEKLKKELFTSIDKFEDDFKENDRPGPHDMGVVTAVRGGGLHRADTEASIRTSAVDESSLTTQESCMTHPCPASQPTQPSYWVTEGQQQRNRSTKTHDDHHPPLRGQPCQNILANQSGLPSLGNSTGLHQYSGNTISKKDILAKGSKSHGELQYVASYGCENSLGIQKCQGTGYWEQGAGGIADFAANSHTQKIENTEQKVKMAMHTEEGEDSGQTSGQTTCDPRPSQSQDDVDKFVGRIKRTRKSQSIAELNESIVESQTHIQNLEGEITRLQEGHKSRSPSQQNETVKKSTNILYQLEMVRKTQEQLAILQKQLQDQLGQQVDSQVISEDQVERQVKVECCELFDDNGNGGTDSAINTSSKCDVVNTSDKSDFVKTTSDKYVVVKTSDNFDQKEDSYNNNSDITTVSSDSKPIVPSGFVQTSDILFQDSSSVGENKRLSSVWYKPLPSLPTTPTVLKYSVSVPPKTPVFCVPKTPVTPGGTPNTPVKPLTPVFHYPPPQVTKTEDPLTPVRTPVALKGVAHIVALTTTTQSCTTVCSVAPTSVIQPCRDTPLDLSSARQHSAGPVNNQTASKFPRTSAFSSVRASPVKELPGSLSLRANVIPSPRGRKEDLSLHRKVCLKTNEKYIEALLDDECALYACRILIEPLGDRGIINPVARILTEGDDMHFVPIGEEGPHAISVRENSAFCCFSP